MSSSALYGYSEDRLQSMLLYVSRGKLPMAAYKLGSDADSSDYMEFLNSATSVMRGLDPTSASQQQQQQRESNKTTLPSLPAVKGAKKKGNGITSLAGNLPREKQVELLSALDDVERELSSIKPPHPQSQSQSQSQSQPVPVPQPPQSEKEVQVRVKDSPTRHEKTKSSSKSTLVGAVEHLPRERQIQLLGALRNLEERIKLTTAQTLHAMDPQYMTGPSTGLQQSIANAGAQELQPIRDPTKRITNAQVAQTLRRLGKAMTSATFKMMHYNFNPVTNTVIKLCIILYSLKLLYLFLLQRENKDVVGLVGIRERVHELLNIRLSDRDVTILMTRFDRSENGMVDLVDILGNAKLYYERSVQEQKMSDELARLRVKNDSFVRRQRQMRMEEKSVINKMLSDKIFEIEKEMKVESGSTLDEYLFADEERPLIEDETISEDYAPGVDPELDGLRETAFNAYRDKKLRYLDAAAPKISLDQFKELLYVFGVHSKELMKTLARRYSADLNGSLIDARKFKTDFKGIAFNEAQQRKQTQAVSSFYRALSGTGSGSASGAGKKRYPKPNALSIDKSSQLINKLHPSESMLERAAYNSFVQELEKRQDDLQMRLQPMEDLGRLQIERNLQQIKLGTSKQSPTTELSDLKDETDVDDEEYHYDDDHDHDNDHDNDRDDKTSANIGDMGDYTDAESSAQQQLLAIKNFSKQVLIAERDHSESGDYEDSFESLSSTNAEEHES